MNRPGLSFKPRACPRCGGDAYLDRSDEPEWRCLQCGRIVPDGSAIANATEEPVAHSVQAKRAA